MIEADPRAPRASTGRLEPGVARPAWLDEAAANVERWAASVRPPLGDRIARIRARVARIHGGSGSLAAALAAKASTPFLALVEALRADMGVPAADPRVRAIGEGAILLYMQVRAQDDLVDEPGLVDRGDVFAIEALSGASLCAFVEATRGSLAFFDFRGDVMRSFAETAAFELDAIHAGAGGDNGLEWLGRKFLPMAVPLGAMAFVAGREADLPGIAGFVTAIGGALQMANDALNIGEDHAAGRATPLLAWLAAGGRLASADSIGRARAVLLSDEALDRALAFAEAEASRAESIAAAMGFERVAAIARERADFVASAPARLLALCLGGIAL